MARVLITYWRDIPLLVRAWDDRGDVTRPLSPRFQELVDAVAMLDGLSDADAYLAEWRTGPEEERAGPPGVVVEAVAIELEAGFGGIRGRALRAPAPTDPAGEP